MSARSIVSALLLAVVACGSGCRDSRPLLTAPGSETKDILPNIAGYVVMDKPRGGMIAIQLPTLKEIVIRPEAPRDVPEFPVVHALSGPDEQGRIAYIDDHFFVRNATDRRHLLKTIRIDGQMDTEIFSRPGSAMWATSPAGRREIGKSLALSPVGGRVAFVSRTTHFQMPSGLRIVGLLEIWDIDKKSGEITNVEVLDEGLAWFHDGKRLVFVKLIDRKSVPASGPNAEALAKTSPGDEKVPSVYLLDVGTGAETFLCVGRTPVVSPDARAVLVSDEDGTWTSVDVATGQRKPITWHGMTRPDWPKTGVVGYPASNVVLAWCLPTEGSRIRYSTTGSFRVGMQMLTLKLARTDSNEFQTVVPYIDRRTEVSFGKAEKYPGK